MTHTGTRFKGHKKSKSHVKVAVTVKKENCLSMIILGISDTGLLTTGLPHAEFALDEVLELEFRKPLYSED